MPRIRTRGTCGRAGTSGRKEAVLLAMLARERYDARAGTRPAAPGRSPWPSPGAARRVTASGRLAAGRGPGGPPPRRRSTCDGGVSALPQVPDLGGPADLVVLAEVLYYLPDELSGGARTPPRWRPRARAERWSRCTGAHHPDDTYVIRRRGRTEELDGGARAGRVGAARWHDDRDFVAASWVLARGWQGRGPRMTGLTADRAAARSRWTCRPGYDAARTDARTTWRRRCATSPASGPGPA